MFGLAIPRWVGPGALVAIILFGLIWIMKKAEAYATVKGELTMSETENAELRGMIDSYALLVEDCNQRVTAAEKIGSDWQANYEAILAEPSPDPEIIYREIMAEAEVAIPSHQQWECGQLAVYSQAFLKRALARAQRVATEGASQ